LLTGISRLSAAIGLTVGLAVMGGSVIGGIAIAAEHRGDPASTVTPMPSPAGQTDDSHDPSATDEQDDSTEGAAGQGEDRDESGDCVAGVEDEAEAEDGAESDPLEAEACPTPSAMASPGAGHPDDGEDD
jgi:hypothetical protein